jgi:hypothetical protein
MDLLPSQGRSKGWEENSEYQDPASNLNIFEVEAKPPGFVTGTKPLRIVSEQFVFMEAEQKDAGPVWNITEEPVRFWFSLNLRDRIGSARHPFRFAAEWSS